MSAPGSVAVTKEIFERVDSTFDGEALGELSIEGKGVISNYCPQQWRGQFPL